MEPRLLGVLRGHEEAVNSVHFLHHGLLASGSGNGVLKLWNIDTKRCTVTINAHGSSMQSIDYLPNSKQLVT